MYNIECNHTLWHKLAAYFFGLLLVTIPITTTFAAPPQVGSGLAFSAFNHISLEQVEIDFCQQDQWGNPLPGALCDGSPYQPPVLYQKNAAFDLLFPPHLRQRRADTRAVDSQNSGSVALEVLRAWLNAESIRQIPQIPIMFEGNIYQPEEYVGYFEEGVEIELYLVAGYDDAENVIFYAFSSKEELQASVMDMFTK